MSGGVGPCKDIGLTSTDNNVDKPTDQQKNRFLSFRQMNSLAVIIVLSSSGMVAVADFAFAIFSFLYLLFLSKLIFPTTPSSHPQLPLFNTHILTLYSLVGTLLGLFLPVLYILQGVVEDDKDGVKAATPHVFLFACQMFLEGAIFHGNFSPPIRAFVPLLYNGKRLVAIMDWLLCEVEVHGSRRRLMIGRGLAAANILFWSFNLFGVLVPVYLPRAFKSYYGGGGDGKDKDQ